MPSFVVARALDVPTESQGQIPRPPIDAPHIARRDIMSAAEIARALNGRHEGRRWRCQCPACGRGNLTVTDMRGGRHLVKCCNGCNYKQVFVALFAQRLLRGDDDDGRDHRRPGDGEVEQRHQLVLANGAPVAAFPGWVLRQLARIERAPRESAQNGSPAILVRLQGRKDCSTGYGPRRAVNAISGSSGRPAEPGPPVMMVRR